MAEGKDLLQVLWNGADVLRGKMDANEYKTYLLGLVFYKYLSDSYLSSAYDMLMNKEPETLEEAQKVYEEALKESDAAELLDELKSSLHYTLEADMTYVSILNDAKIIALIVKNFNLHLTESKSRMSFLMDCLLM